MKGKHGRRSNKEVQSYKICGEAHVKRECYKGLAKSYTTVADAGEFNCIGSATNNCRCNERSGSQD